MNCIQNHLVQHQTGKRTLNVLVFESPGGTLITKSWSFGSFLPTRSATNWASSQNNLTNSFASLRNFSGGNSGGANFGGFGGVRASGTVSKVNNSEVTIKLDDPTQINNFKVGDSSRLTNFMLWLEKY